MKQQATQMYRFQRELVNHAIQTEESLRNSPITPMASCSLGAFCLEAGIDMRELPGAVGVIILAHKAWQQ